MNVEVSKPKTKASKASNVIIKKQNPSILGGLLLATGILALSMQSSSEDISNTENENADPSMEILISSFVEDIEKWMHDDYEKIALFFEKNMFHKLEEQLECWAINEEWFTLDSRLWTTLLMLKPNMNRDLDNLTKNLTPQKRDFVVSHIIKRAINLASIEIPMYDAWCYLSDNTVFDLDKEPLIAKADDTIDVMGVSVRYSRSLVFSLEALTLIDKLKNNHINTPHLAKVTLLELFKLTQDVNFLEAFIDLVYINTISKNLPNEFFMLRKIVNRFRVALQENTVTIV